MGQVVGVAQMVMSPLRSTVPEFKTDAESPAGDGARVVLSEPIVDMLPEDFWDIFVHELKTEHPPNVSGSPCDRKFFERPDGSILLVPIVPMGKGRKVALHILWYLDIDQRRAVGVNYDTDETLTRESFRVTLRTYENPFRIECRTQIRDQRDAGEAQRQVMESMLSSIGSRARCYEEADSPGSPGLHSVLSDEISEPVAVPPDALWRQSKEHIRAQAQTVLPDGSALQGLRSRWRFWDSSLHWTKHVFDDEALEVRAYSYGCDASLAEESLKRVSHLRIHRQPYRLEMFELVPEHVAAGEAQKDFLIELVGPVFSRRKELEKQAEYEAYAGLDEELKSSQSEVRELLAALTSDMKVLREQMKTFKDKLERDSPPELSALA